MPRRPGRSRGPWRPGRSRGPRRPGRSRGPRSTSHSILGTPQNWTSGTISAGKTRDTSQPISGICRPNVPSRDVGDPTHIGVKNTSAILAHPSYMSGALIEKCFHSSTPPVSGRRHRGLLRKSPFGETALGTPRRPTPTCLFYPYYSFRANIQVPTSSRQAVTITQPRHNTQLSDVKPAH